MPMVALTTILVCQNTACRKMGAAVVLKRLQEQAVEDVAIAPSGCLGKCGNGPNLLVLPEKRWYERVRPEDIQIILAETVGDRMQAKNRSSGQAGMDEKIGADLSTL